MIRDVILTQKREVEKKLNEKYIERKVDYNKFNNDLIKVIIGPRRSGKSLLGINILKKYKKFGYVNFDDERLTDIKNYDEIINNVDSIYNNPEVILFDEIQNLNNWELFVNRLYKIGKNIILTGSNSKLLSRELASHLTGRHISIPILPFSFSEYLKLFESELTSLEIKNKVSDYIEYGGYPEPLVKKIDIKEYLSTLFDSIIYKDIVKRYNIRNPAGIDELAIYLISNIAKEFSYNTLTKITKCSSVKTVEKYLGYLEEAFLFFKIPKFSYKLKEQITANKKIYCIDNGLIYSKAFKFSMDIGKLYENIIAILLKKKELNNELNFYFWKNNQNEEVDFVIKKGTKVESLIQVAYNLNAPKTLEREKRALVKAKKELACNNLYIINYEIEKEEIFKWYGEKAKIIYVPLWKWLLENE